MTLGPWVVFDQWLNNMADAGGNIIIDDVFAVLCGSAQVLSRSFVGASTDCRYADLTAELPTGSGYTAGGIIIPNKTVTRVGGVVTLDADFWEWTIAPDIAGIKYCVLLANETPNKDLIAFMDFDTTNPANTVTGHLGLRVAPHADGIIKWYQP